jgi:transposase-like protein
LRAKILACLLYMSGLSYRAMTCQTGVVEASHVSVSRWVHALKGIVSHPPRSERKVVAIDETKPKIRGRKACLRVGCD